MTCTSNRLFLFHNLRDDIFVSTQPSMSALFIMGKVLALPKALLKVSLEVVCILLLPCKY